MRAGQLLTAATSAALDISNSAAEYAKCLVIGDNVMTGLDWVGSGATAVLLVGGGASDDELVRAVSEQLGHRFSVGRGDVDGRLGHRFAVAYGLVALAAGG